LERVPGQRHRRCARGRVYANPAVRRALAPQSTHLTRKVGWEAVTHCGGGPVMAIITPTRIKHGWQVVQGDLTLDAENPHFDRGAIRAALTVRNCTAIYYRDTANLTSVRSRARIVQALAKQDVHLSEEALIALDEACRQRPAPSPAKTMRRDGEGDFS